MGVTRATVLWVGMIAAGVGLGAVVVAAWPDPTVRVVRLPYGEAQPKAPVAAVAERTDSTATSVGRPWEPPVVAEEETAARVLSGVEPAPSSGPAPVPSQLELEPSYVQESPEELGADPLPGVEVTEPPVR